MEDVIFAQFSSWIRSLATLIESVRIRVQPAVEYTSIIRAYRNQTETPIPASGEAHIEIQTLNLEMRTSSCTNTL